VEVLARDLPLGNGDAQVKAYLEQKLIQHIRLSAIFKEVVLIAEQGLVKVCRIGVPSTDI
jgi:hypothetical protein